MIQFRPDSKVISIRAFIIARQILRRQKNYKSPNSWQNLHIFDVGYRLFMFIVFLGAQKSKFLACRPIEGPLFIVNFIIHKERGPKEGASHKVNTDTSHLFAINNRNNVAIISLCMIQVTGLFSNPRINLILSL